METQTKTNNTSVQSDSTSNNKKNMLIIGMTTLIAGVALFFYNKYRNVKYKNGNIEIPDKPIIPMNLNPNDIKIQLTGLRVHNISFSGIEISIDARVANTTNYDLSVNDLNGEFYHLGSRGERFLTSTQRVKPVSINRHKTVTIENIRFKVPLFSVMPVVTERFKGYDRFKIKVVLDINGQSIVVQKQIKL